MSQKKLQEKMFNLDFQTGPNPTNIQQPDPTTYTKSDPTKTPGSGSATLVLSFFPVEHIYFENGQ